MALQTVTLKKAALAFSVHPRTILRAIMQNHNTYWYEDSDNDVMEIHDIAQAYGMSDAALVAVIEGRDSLIRAGKAAEILGLADRTLRKHMKVKGVPERLGRVHYGKITRYLESRINTAAIARME